jgi:polyisoprenoid-binding protein YceI
MLLRIRTLRALFARILFTAFLSTAAGSAIAQSPGVYEIDSQSSEIHWRIYKAGAFARFGHNHVIAIAQPSGTVELEEDIGASGVTLQFAVGELVIDDPELRSRYGEDFASEPSAEDVAGTRTNMLTEQVLNGDVFPTISLTGSQLSGLGEDQTIELTIAMLGRTVSVTVPVSVTFEDGALRAQAEFRLQHEDLEMEPFSVMMGALQVAPEIDFTVDIRAVPRGSATAL